MSAFMNFAAAASLAALTAFSPGVALADKLALVVGVNAYADGPELRLAVPDAQLIGGTLEKLGFSVTLVTDPDRPRMIGAIAEFVERVQGDDTAVFYFAGTGVEVDGDPLMFMTDAPINAGDEESLRAQAISLNALVASVEADSRGLNVFIFDACRDDPFAGLRGGGVLTRDIRIETMPAHAQSFIMYSTHAGALVEEPADAPNTPFAALLSQKLLAATDPLADIARDIRVEIIRQTNGRQRPGFYDGTDGDVFLWPQVTNPVPPADIGGTGDESAAALGDEEDLLEVEPGPVIPAHGIAVPEDPLAAAAFTVLETHCSRCHQQGALVGRTKSPRDFNFILELEKLGKDSRYVVPGDPNASQIIKEIVANEMPYDVMYDYFPLPEVSESELETLRKWIADLGAQQPPA